MADDAGGDASAGHSTVAQALASGEWKQKVDVKTGKKYFVHVESKRSVWNLEKELARRTQAPSATTLRAGGSASATLEKLTRDERHQRARMRVEAETTLKAQITQLEQSKVDLEMEIARLIGPIELETAALGDMQAQQGDKQGALIALQQEARERRRARDAELQSIQKRVMMLQGAFDSSKSHREALEARHKQLMVEAHELKADLEKELHNTDTLKQSLVAMDSKAADAKLELARLHSKLAEREREIAVAEDDLRAAHATANELRAAIEERQALKLELTAKIKRVREVQQTAYARSADRVDLSQEYSRKLKQLSILERHQDAVETAGSLEVGNAKLQQLILAAQRDQTALARMNAVVLRECQRVAESLATLRRETKAAEAEVQRYTRPPNDHGGDLPAV